MFNKNFYPTPDEVITLMLNGYDIAGKTVYEPSAGKGNIVDYLLKEGAEVIASELNEDLRKILATKCKIIGSDFLQVKAEQVSHIDFIIMNPPFSADEKHIIHAWEIAPPGCKIISLCNLDTVKLFHGFHHAETNKLKLQLESIIKENGGRYEDLGDCFKTSERKTSVQVALVHLQKPSDNYETEFNGFFTEEEEEKQGEKNGLMEYNAVRDLVNRYIAAVKLYDKQIELGLQMNDLISTFYNMQYFSYGEGKEFEALVISPENKMKLRAEFKKRMQKAGWKFIFDKLNMEKYSTAGLKRDINKFVEEQQNVPFTMKNIYAMLQIVVGTTSQRMDKALLEVFDKLTERYHENRYCVEGWKTNSHYLVNRKFIFPYGAERDYDDVHVKIPSFRSGSPSEILTDTEKALCYLVGTNYDEIYGIGTLGKMRPGQWCSTHFFRVKAYKKGTIHCEFKDEEIWADFNQRIAKLKGYPLYEHKKATSKKEKEKEEKQEAETAKNYRPSSTLFETELATI